MTDRFGSPQTRALLAVVDGARTVRDVQRTVGWANPSSAWQYLAQLRAAGLVDWVDGKMGTLHPLVARVDLSALGLPVPATGGHPCESSSAPTS